MKRGEVYWALFEPRSGSEQHGLRPAIVMSTDALNGRASWQSIIVVPFSTSGAQARRGPTAVMLPPSITGLQSESVVLCHQITTLDRGKFRGRIGALDHASLTRVEAGIRAALDID